MIEHLMRDRDEEPRGRLRVSVPVMLGQQIMGQVAADYTARWPKTEIDVVLTDRKSHLIEENFDCAIRIGPLKDSSYIAKRLAWSHTILVASPKLLADRLQPSTPAALSDWPTIGFAPAGLVVSWALENGDRQVKLSPRSAITLGGLHAVCDAAIAGGGVALIPSLTASEALTDGRLVRLLEDWRGLDSSINIIYPSRHYPSARLRGFIEVLEDMFSVSNY